MVYNVRVCGVLFLSDYSILADETDFWTYWGFEPWEHMGMKGVYRKVTFVKSSLMGEVARYYAYDYIVLTHRGKIDADVVYKNWKPEKDVMLHRFLFVEESATQKKRIRSFLMGFKGFMEIYHYSVNTDFDKKIKDLAPLVDKAWKLSSETRSAKERGDGIE
jgi:hypothetical protein